MLFNLLAFSGLAAAAVIPRADAGCSNPATRKEWRTLSTEERTSYIDAIKCMTKKPSRIGLDTSLYDDFPYVHDKLNNDIHAVASFLPWHRYFVHLYEEALKECGYTGSATYWDWTLDAADTAHSSIWDAETGIGGNGNNSHTESLGYMSTSRCVTDGPFKDLRPAYHGSSYKPHCLGRHFNAGGEDPGDMLSFAYTPEVVSSIQKSSTDYATFRYKLEGTPHGAIHSAIGGDMAPSTSPNDPVFFLHHTQIDRLWYLWQQDAPETRNSEFGGNRIPDKFDGTTPPEASATDVMPFLGLADDLLVKDVLSTQTSLLCYKY